MVILMMASLVEHYPFFLSLDFLFPILVYLFTFAILFFTAHFVVIHLSMFAGSPFYPAPTGLRDQPNV